VVEEVALRPSRNHRDNLADVDLTKGLRVRRSLAVLVAVTVLLPTRSADAHVGPRPTVTAAEHASSAEPSQARRSGEPARTRARHGASKLLVFVVENHSLSEMKQQMPWTYHLARRFGHATRYTAVAHPSLPNYLAIAGGSTYGVTDDGAPQAHPLGGRSVFGRAVRAGMSARVYAENMPQRCATSSSGEYAVKHNPWPYFVHERGSCRKHDVAMAGFRHDVRHGRLPAAGMVVPNLCNDAHDCSLTVADRWLKKKVGLAMSGPDFKKGRLAIVVTADEDDRSQGNTVLTILAHHSVRHVVTHARLTHFSLCRLYTQVLGVSPLRQAAHAPSMAHAFGLRLRRH
jgi:acid phosphatase